jgi:hypothetical protein
MRSEEIPSNVVSVLIDDEDNITWTLGRFAAEPVAELVVTSGETLYSRDIAHIVRGTMNYAAVRGGGFLPGKKYGGELRFNGVRKANCSVMGVAEE